MILFSWSERKEEKPMFSHIGRRAWRWALELCLGGIWVSRQMIRLDDKEPKWYNIGEHFGIYSNS